MKKLLLLLFLIPVFAAAQKTTGENYTYIAQRYEWLAGVFKALGLPAGSGPAAFTSGQEMRAGAIFYDSTDVDSGLYVYSGLAWRKIALGDGTNIYNSNGTLTESRTIDGDGNNITWDNFFGININANNIVETLVGNKVQNVTARWYLNVGDSVKIDITNGILNIPTLLDTDDSTTYKPIARASDGRVRQFTHWPGGGGANLLFDSLGTDGISPNTTWDDTLFARRISVTGGLSIDTTASGGLVIDASAVAGSPDAYTSVDLINDTTFVLIRDDLTADTVVISGGGGSGGGMTNPMTTQGDIIYGGASGAETRLAGAATDNHVLKYDLDTNTPYWGAESGGSSEFGIVQSSTYTLTSTTSTQKLFDAVTNGEITVASNTTYLFECIFSLTAMSATSGNCTFDIIGAGTATFTSTSWIGNTRDASLGGATAASNIFSETSASSGQIAQAATATALYAHLKGIIRVNAGGTIIPSVGLVTAAAAVVGTNSYFKLTPIGNGSVTSW